MPDRLLKMQDTIAYTAAPLFLQRKSKRQPRAAPRDQFFLDKTPVNHG
jgi:hypothetical protein